MARLRGPSEHCRELAKQLRSALPTASFFPNVACWHRRGREWRRRRYLSSRRPLQLSFHSITLTIQGSERLPLVIVYRDAFSLPMLLSLPQRNATLATAQFLSIHEEHPRLPAGFHLPLLLMIGAFLSPSLSRSRECD